MSTLPGPVESVLSTERIVAATYNGASTPVMFVCAICQCVVRDLDKHYTYAIVIEARALVSLHQYNWTNAIKKWPEGQEPLRLPRGMSERGGTN